MAEVLRWGRDGMLVACGTLLKSCVQAADRLAKDGLHVGVINARFVKPLDRQTILRAVRECPLVVTVEEGALMGGFGSAVLEAAATPAWTPAASTASASPTNSSNMATARNCWPTLGLNAQGIAETCRDLADGARQPSAAGRRPGQLRSPSPKCATG